MRTQVVSPDKYYPKALRGASLSESLLADGKTVKVPLTQGSFALVDVDSFEKVSNWKWSPKGKKGNEYAGIVAKSNRTGSRTTIYMHILIFHPRSKKDRDHKNGDRMDNRKSNLRLCTAKQNGANHKLQKNNKSGFNGVSYIKRISKWESYIGNRKRDGMLIGRFGTKEEAAKAYDREALKMYGQFARLNFPTGEPSGVSI